MALTKSIRNISYKELIPGHSVQSIGLMEKLEIYPIRN